MIPSVSSMFIRHFSKFDSSLLMLVYILARVGINGTSARDLGESVKSQTTSFDRNLKFLWLWLKVLLAN